MYLDQHSPASVASLKEDATEEVQTRSAAFREHLVSLSQETTTVEHNDAGQDSTKPGNGSKNPFILKKLSQKHKDMITLSLQGLSREKVGEYCGCRPEYVSMINKQPLARSYIAGIEEHLDLRLRGMYGKSIDAIAAGLTGPKVSDRLSAAQLHLGAIGKLKPIPGEGRDSAEDVVAAMLVQGNNVQINVKK